MALMWLAGLRAAPALYSRFLPRDRMLRAMVPGWNRG